MDGAPTATVSEALRHAARLLRDDARLAAAQAREILAVSPGNADAYRLLGAALRRTGDGEAAERAELDAIAASVGDADLMRAAEALVDNDLPVAEHILRPHLKRAADRRRRDPDDGRAGGAARPLSGRREPAAPRARARPRLRRRRAPTSPPSSTSRTGPPRRSPSWTGCRAPTARRTRISKAAALGRIGGYEEAIGLYEAVLARMPGPAQGLDELRPCR